MKRYHDIGGDPAGPVVLSDHPVEPWAKLITATMSALRARGYGTVDATRRTIEDLPPELYDRPYFERWAEALVRMLEEKGLATRAEIEARMDKMRAELETHKKLEAHEK